MEINSQRHASADLPRGKETTLSFNRRLGGPQRRLGRFREEKNILRLRRIELFVILRLSSP